MPSIELFIDVIDVFWFEWVGNISNIWLCFQGPAHKLALFNGKPHEFLSGGEDGLIIHIDVRQPKPTKLGK